MTPADWSVGAYIRVSSRAQDHASQRDAIERAAKARGQSIRYWFSEKQSAKTIDRPELDALRVMARAGGLSALYVFRLDRLARSGIRDTLDVVQELKGAGVKLVTVADGFDLEGPAWEIIAAVMAWAAQMERNATNERIAAARIRIEAEGGSWGRPERMTPELVARARRMKDAGLSIRGICAALKVPRSTLAKTLERHHGGKEDDRSRGATGVGGRDRAADLGPGSPRGRSRGAAREAVPKTCPETGQLDPLKYRVTRTRRGAVPKVYKGDTRP